jgi:ABC-2 type transport system permease protein
MTVALTSTFSNLFDPVRFFGPIFDKELRVASRRLRNYFLRFAYILLLSIFILSIWYSVLGIRSSGSAVYVVSRFSSAGRQIITAIAWFQFVAAQLIAIVMLSSSVSDEIHTGTLSVLLTTPISRFQIVAGKLLSKLLQLILLLAISLPLLAVVRVFGGVTWNYVVSSVCITMTAVMLAGAVSLFLSIIYRHAHIVILVTIAIYLLIFGALSGLFNLLAVKGISILNRDVTQSLLALTNPFVAFAAENVTLLQSGTPKFFSWPIHCLIMLVVTAVLITISVLLIRQATLQKAFDQPGKLLSALIFKRKGKFAINRTNSQSSFGSILPVTGPPIIWKEMRKRVIGHSKKDITISVLFISIFLITAVLVLSSARNSVFSHYIISGFYLIAMIRMAMFSAGSIAFEKEARTWSVLLTTPLEDREIVRGKAIAAFRRNYPILLLYIILLCILFFRIAGIRSIIGVVFNLLSIASSVLFVIGSGLYFGVRLKTATSAITATIGTYIILTYILCGMFNPLRILLYSAIFRAGPNYNFFVQLLSFATSIIPTIALGGIGIFLERRAVRQLRRNIF